MLYQLSYVRVGLNHTQGQSSPSTVEAGGATPCRSRRSPVIPLLPLLLDACPLAAAGLISSNSEQHE